MRSTHKCIGVFVFAVVSWWGAVLAAAQSGGQTGLRRDVSAGEVRPTAEESVPRALSGTAPVPKEIAEETSSDSGVSLRPNEGLSGQVRSEPRENCVQQDEYAVVVRSHPEDKLAEADPAFARFVDFRLLERAIVKADSSLLADIAFSLAEGERVLARTHHQPGLTSEMLVRKAAVCAYQTNDQATAKRLEQAAESLRKPNWRTAIEDAKEFSGKSRAPGPLVPLGTLDLDTVMLITAVEQASRVAALTRDTADLEQLKGVVQESVKDEKIRTYLRETIDRSLGSVTGKRDVADELLAEFAAGSRQEVYRHWFPGPVNVDLNWGGLGAKLVFHLCFVVYDDNAAIEGWWYVRPHPNPTGGKVAQNDRFVLIRVPLQGRYTNRVGIGNAVAFDGTVELSPGCAAVQAHLIVGGKSVMTIVDETVRWAVPLGPRNGSEFRYTAGVFRKVDDFRWVERRQNGSDSWFVQKAVNAEYVELFDAQRQMYVRLLQNCGIFRTQNAGQWYRWPGSEGSWVR